MLKESIANADTLFEPSQPAPVAQKRRPKGVPEAMTKTWKCEKRNGSTVPFDPNKIRKALAKCFESVETQNPPVDRIVHQVILSLLSTSKTSHTVEEVQQRVVAQLFIAEMFDEAEHYQNYREEHRRLRERETAPIFAERLTIEPPDYPDIEQYQEAINSAFWTVKHWYFTSDIHEYRTVLTDSHRSVINRSLMAISQVEVGVKSFWLRLGDRFRKPEFAFVGVTVAENEVRHSKAYSGLLKALNLNGDFANAVNSPALRKRVDYTNAVLKRSRSESDREYVLGLVMFSLFIENVSLFGQFLTVQAFHRDMRVLKDVDSVVQATSKEEKVHANLGIAIVGHIRRERPEWFDEAFYDKVRETALEAYAAESEIVDWVLEGAELPFLPRASVDAFLRHRFNEGIEAIGGEKLFDVDAKDLDVVKWFLEQEYAEVRKDTFHKTSTSYSVRTASATTEDLF